MRISFLLCFAALFATLIGCGDPVRDNLVKELELYAPDFDKRIDGWKGQIAAADRHTGALPEERANAAEAHVEVKAGRDEIREHCDRWSRISKHLHDDPRLDERKKGCEDLLAEATRSEKALRLKLAETAP